MLGHVLPRLATNDAIDCLPAHVVNVSEVPHGRTVSMHQTNQAYGRLVELACGMGFSTQGPFRMPLHDVAALFGGILHVVRAGSQEQMVYADAVTDVAMVAYVNAVRNGSVSQHPCKSVS